MNHSYINNHNNIAAEKIDLHSIGEAHFDALMKIWQLLNDNGKESRLVGGIVRDLLLLHNDLVSSEDNMVDIQQKILQPDIDMTTEYIPEEVMAILATHNIKCLPTGVDFGTVTAVLQYNSDGHITNSNNIHIEITTLRADIKTDGRHAEVKYHDDHPDRWHLDSMRRDFTFNALYADINGNIYDYHNGIGDLQNMAIKFIGDTATRIKEDALRIIRYFRFAAYLTINFNHANHQDLLTIAHNRNLLAKLSGERIYAEFSKILGCYSAVEMIAKAMSDYGLDKDGLLLPEELHETNIILICQIALIIAKIKTEYLTDINIKYLFIIAIIYNNNHAITLDNLSWLKQRWALPSRDYKAMKLIVKNFHDNQQKQLYEFARSHGKDLAISLFILQNAYHKVVLPEDKSNNASKDDNDIANHYNEFISDLRQFQFPPFPLSGKDLQEIGIAPGKEMGELLEKLKHIWIDSAYQMDKKQLLDFIRSVTK